MAAAGRQDLLTRSSWAPLSPDAPPALRELRQGGLRLVVASNWDCSLPDWLEPAGITELVDGVVTSAEVGAPKPNPRVF